MRNKKGVNIILAIVLTTLLTFAVPASTIVADELVVEKHYEQPYLGEIAYVDFYDLDIIGMYDIYDIYLIKADEMFFAEYLEIQRIMEMQAPAVEAYSILMETFMDYYGNLIFPDNYAGSYLRDHQILVIQLTEVSEESMAFYTNIIGYDVPIEFKEVNFSYNQLWVFGEIFTEAIVTPITSLGVDVMNNSFTIGLYQGYVDNMQAIDDFSAFSRLFPIPINFKLENFAEVSMLRGGYDLGGFSVGLTGYRAGVRSMITTGHAFRGATTDVAVFRNGVSIGNLHSYRFGNLERNAAGRPNGDWAVITLNVNGQAMMTNQVRNGLQIRGTTAPPLRNSIVSGTGMRTLRYHGAIDGTGLIRYVEYAPGRVQRVTGLASARTDQGSVFPVPGDSGGPIWHVLSNGTNAMTGVLAAAHTSTFTWYFSPLSTANHFAPRVTP